MATSMSMLPELQIATTDLHFRRIDRDTDIRTGPARGPDRNRDQW